MKTICSLLIYLIFSINLLSSQTLSEGFEDWIDTLSTIGPKGWTFSPVTGIDTLHKNINRVASINEGDYAVNLRSSVPTGIDGYHSCFISKRLPIPSNKITISLTYKCEGFGRCSIAISQGFQDSVVYPGQRIISIPAGDTASHSIVLEDITVDPGSEIFRFVTFSAHQGGNPLPAICSFTIDSLNIEMTPLVTSTHLVLEERKVNIHPNPTRSKVFFSIDSDDLSLPSNIEVYNVRGQLILSESNTTEIDLQNQPDGIYYLKTFLGNEIQVDKIIKVD